MFLSLCFLIFRVVVRLSGKGIPSNKYKCTCHKIVICLRSVMCCLEIREDLRFISNACKRKLVYEAAVALVENVLMNSKKVSLARDEEHVQKILQLLQLCSKEKLSCPSEVKNVFTAEENFMTLLRLFEADCVNPKKWNEKKLQKQRTRWGSLLFGYLTTQLPVVKRPWKREPWNSCECKFDPTVAIACFVILNSIFLLAFYQKTIPMWPIQCGKNEIDFNIKLLDLGWILQSIYERLVLRDKP